MSRFFSKKSFSWGTNFYEQKHYGDIVLNGRTNDQMMPRCGRSFIDDKWMHFPVIWTLQIFTWRLSPGHYIKLWKDLFWRLIVKRFQNCAMFSFPYGDINILFETLIPETGTLIWKLCLWRWGFHAKLELETSE